MKKIKYLLGIGLLCVLLGFSFASDNSKYNVEYFGFQGEINNYHFNVTNGYSLNSLIASGGDLVSFSPYLVSSSLSSYDDSVLNVSNYSLNIGSYGHDSENRLFYDNGKISLLFSDQYTLFPVTPGVTSTNSLLSSNSTNYIRVLNNSSSCFLFDSINGNCSMFLRSFVFSKTLTYDSFRGIIHDSVKDGQDVQKGTVVSSVYDNYSFTYALTDYVYELYNIYITGGELTFKSVIPTNSGNYYSLSGVYLMRLNNLYLVDSSSSYQVLAIAFTGNSMSDYDFIYSLYNCPSTSRNIYDCSYSEGGYLRPSGLDSSFASFDGKLFSTSYGWGSMRADSPNVYRSLLFFLFLPLSQENTSLTFYNRYQNGIVHFYRPYGDNSVMHYSLSLSSIDGIDIIGGTTPPPGTSNSSGSIAINSGLLNSCLNYLTFGELTSYLCNQLLGNLGYPVQIPGTSGQYISVSIDENGNLTYRITTQEDLAEQMSGFIWVENEDGTRSTVCPSGNCLGTVLAQPIIHSGSFELTTGDLLDMITNLTGRVGRCPFPYTDFRLGKNLKLLQLLQDYGFKYDPFVIINCSVAGFHYGRHTIDNTLFGDTFEHPLLYGDTPKHRALFVFLDFVVILGLLGLFTFIKKIF